MQPKLTPKRASVPVIEVIKSPSAKRLGTSGEDRLTESQTPASSPNISTSPALEQPILVQLPSNFPLS